MNNIREILGDKIPKTATHYVLRSGYFGRNKNYLVRFLKRHPREQDPKNMKTRVMLTDVQQVMIEGNLKSQYNPNGYFELNCIREIV